MNKKSKVQQLKVMLDTSFLIALFTPEDEFHDNALRYFQYLKHQNAKFYISSLALAEYSLKSNAMKLIMGTIGPKIIGYNATDALAYGPLVKQFDWIYKPKKAGISKPEKERIIIDFMMAAHAENQKLDYILSCDKAFVKHVNDLEGFNVEIINFSRPPEENTPIFKHLHELEDVETPKGLDNLQPPLDEDRQLN